MAFMAFQNLGVLDSPNALILVIDHYKCLAAFRAFFRTVGMLSLCATRSTLLIAYPAGYRLELRAASITLRCLVLRECTYTHGHRKCSNQQFVHCDLL